MSQDNLQKMMCGSCKNITYFTNKNRRKVERKLEFSKYCRFCKQHTSHKEAKRK